MRIICHNGEVYTGALPLQEAFVVEGDTFSFVGSSGDALALAGEGDAVVDLKGSFVCAGFNDSHMHLLSYGKALSEARLDEHTGSLADMLDCLRRQGERKNRGWIVGRGWNQDYFTDAARMPDRWDLDRVSRERPVCAVRCCGHAMAVNSRALEELGITADTPQPEGGEICIRNGQPTGLLLDNAMDLVYGAMPAPDVEEVKDMLRAACAGLNRYGVTSCQSDDYCVYANLPWQTVNAAYRELEEAGELTVRVYEQSNFADIDSLRSFVEAGNRTGTGTERFKIGPLKMLGDGALGPRSAFLSAPYADDGDKVGLSVFSQETFDELIGYANEQGMQVAIHAIGDACLDRVLLAIDRALERHPRENHRHGIVHCQITRPDQLRALAERRLHIYAQSIFLDYDIHMVESRVGKERAASGYSWKTLLENGCTVSNGTDCPVELPFALGGIQCAVTRRDLKGGEKTYLPEQAFTVRQALDSYTAAGAYASFEEERKGRIRPGMLADFTVLGENPFAVDAQRIKDIPVLAVFSGGREVYRREEQ